MKLHKPTLYAIISISLFVLATTATWLYSRIHSALPLLEGKETIYGLTATTTIKRDALGVPTIIAQNRADIAVALGFVHAQERFFQMDLLRRNSAGELSSLFGEVALAHDKDVRVHRFRERARAIVQQLPADQVSLLKAYTRGVNQGLKYLKAAPFEYLLLRQDPVSWHEEDTILTVFSMYLDLQYGGAERELTLGIMETAFNQEVFDFLNPKGSQWDATLDGTSYAPSPMPKDAWPQVSQTTRAHHHVQPELPLQEYFVGSNNWAVSGAISTTNSAIIANDMHLGIRVPNTWYKARLNYITSNGQAVDISGVSLPGTPSIVVGSNTKIAWGFTNSNGDWSDVVVLKTNEDKSQYLTPNGYQDFIIHPQMIAVKNKKAIEVDVKETIWGPVIGENSQGELLAYRWVAHDLNAVNLGTLGFETANNIDEAFVVAASSGIPAQNLMVGDYQGHIGWTIAGPIPKKTGNIGPTPQDWSTGKNGWSGYLPVEEYPRIKNPKENRLWTANSRVVGGDMYKKLGNGGYALGARSQQIRDRLFESEQFDEKKLLAIALDTEARFLQRWQTFMLDNVLTESAIKSHPQWQEAKTFIQNTELSADADSVAYRIVRNFRLQVRNITFEDMVAHLKSIDGSFDFKTVRNQLEVPLWQLINQQPSNFTWMSRDSWQALFDEALDKTLEDMTVSQPLSKATWGQENQAQIVHPLASAIPLFGHYLNMPTQPLPGDGFVPRVDGGSFGASERMVISPGHEKSGILHMPTSQAGHPWSPYFGKGHQDWVQGNPSPLLPGKTVYELTLLSY